MPFVGTDPNDYYRPGMTPGPLATALPPPVPVNIYDYTSDPLYQRTLALGQQRTEQANAAALRAQTQSLIDYGDPDLVRSLGLGEDIAAAAAQNPFSIMAQLRKGEHDRPIALDESLNKQNLFYSGHRGLAQSDLAQSLGQERYGAGQREQGTLTGIENTRLGALSTVADQNEAAAEAAAGRTQARLGDLPPPRPLAPAAIAPGLPRLAARVTATPTQLRQAIRPSIPRSIPRGYRRPLY
jgi:hypothetical protein